MAVDHQFGPLSLTFCGDFPFHKNGNQRGRTGVFAVPVTVATERSGGIKQVRASKIAFALPN
jgi:hypothetical protein